MSKIRIVGHASGSGILTIAAPNTDTDRTITIPDVTGTLLDSGSDLPAANLTGTIADARFPATLPAASAANLTAIPAANITGTLPAISATNLTNVPAANITGTLPAISGANLTGVRDTTGGRKNLIINGDFQIDQRGYSGSTSADGNNYTVDRWTNYFATTVTKSKEVISGRSRGVLNLNSASQADIGQRIEHSDNISGQTMSLSFWAKNVSGNTDNKFQIGNSIDAGIINQNFTTTASWQKFEYTFTLAAFSNLSGTAYSYCSFQVNTAGASWSLAEVQLELGSVATDFEHRTYAESLLACQRYYEIIAKPTAADDSPYFGIGHGVKTDQINWFYDFKAEKRAPFTLIVNTVTNGYYGKNHSSEFNKNTLGVTMGHQSLHSIMGYMTGISGVAEQSTWTMQCNGAGCLIAVSAEL